MQSTSLALTTGAFCSLSRKNRLTLMGKGVILGTVLSQSLLKSAQTDLKHCIFSRTATWKFCCLPKIGQALFTLMGKIYAILPEGDHSGMLLATPTALYATSCRSEKKICPIQLCLFIFDIMELPCSSHYINSQSNHCSTLYFVLL